LKEVEEIIKIWYNNENDSEFLRNEVKNGGRI